MSKSLLEKILNIDKIPKLGEGYRKYELLKKLQEQAILDLKKIEDKIFNPSRRDH